MRHVEPLYMDESIEKQVFIRILKAGRGSLFYTDSFATLGNARAVAKALERLTKSGKLQRVATGIYVRPLVDKMVGVVLPGIEEIAEAIAKRDKARIVPTGSYALYKLGLTTQVPLNVVFYTDASARKIKVGKQTITFKRASAKSVSAMGSISKLAIQALRSMGKDNVSEEEIQKIQEFLRKEKPFHLQHDVKLAPEWIRKILRPILQEND